MPNRIHKMQVKDYHLNTAVFLFLSLPLDALARAGGAMAKSSKGGGMFQIGAWLASLVFIAIAGYCFKQKVKKVRALLQYAAQKDKIWAENTIKPHVKKVFFALQNSYKLRQAELAKDYLTQKLYDQHAQQCEDLLAAYLKPVMLGITLKELEIVRIHDANNDQEDAFCAYLRGTMVDGLFNEKTKQSIGESDYLGFEECWHFTRNGDQWLLDRISDDASKLEISLY